MLSIIIVNYRSAGFIKEAIETFRLYNHLTEHEIIVVDNYSQDNSKEVLLNNFPGIHWLQMGYNAGFARANNSGMKMAKGETFLLLNPDTLCIDNSIEECYRKLNSSQYAAAGVQLVNEKLHPQISGSYFMKGGMNHILPIPYWGEFLRWLGYKLKTKVPNVKVASSVEEVDWISGAFLMVKTEAVEKAGMMDEDFFLYAEEVEWCSRLKSVGRLCIYGDLKIIHLEGGSIDKEHNIQERGYYNLYDKKGLQLMVSNHLRVRKQYGAFWFMFLLLNYSWGVIFYFLISTLHNFFKLKNPFADWKRASLFFKNVIKLWILSPHIISKKPHFFKVL